MNNTPPFKTLSTEVSWTSPYYEIHSSALLLPDGKPATYHVVTKEDAVFVVPVTPQNEVVLIRQYRFTVEEWCWEIPAGGIRAGLSPFDAAVEELHEEVGGVAQQWQALTSCYTANGICNEKGYFFLATGVTLGETAHEPLEFIEVHCKPIPDVLRMARTGEMSDGKSVLALLLCQQELLELGG